MKAGKPSGPEGQAAATHPKPLRRRGAARVIAESPASPSTSDGDAFAEHPDGWYWMAPDGKQQFGPFETCSLARADRDRYSAGLGSVEVAAESETLRESEQAIGMGEWIDTETGEPAEGQCPPHLEER